MQCIPLSGYCDFRADCANNVDEHLCYDVREQFDSKVRTPGSPVIVILNHLNNKIMKRVTRRTVQQWGAPCPGTHFICPGIHLCLPVVARCNGVNDCPGQEDEVGCDSYTCPGRSSIMWLVLVGCLTSQQHASVSQGRICSDNFTCCHTEIEVADQLSISPSHSILTPGQPVPALTL